MKKVLFNQYGGEEVLQITDTAIPIITAKQLLIKVKSVSINPLDWKIYRGEMKLMTGSKFPKGLGIDFSGTVEKAGSEVSTYKKGDSVFGLVEVFKGGALAEYVVVTEKAIVLKPANISFEQAAALPVAGSAALQIVEKLLEIKQGTEILINGATGGIGMFVVQLAKAKGAIVTSVTSTKGISLAQSWGSNKVIDYTKVNVLHLNSTFDIVLDLSGKMSFKDAKVLMKPKSTYINTIPGPREILGSFFNNLFSGKKYKILLLKPSVLYLHSLSLLAARGMKIVVDHVFALSQIKEVYREVSKGGIIGKAIVTLS
jgi:NADPH:quinone reductase-like Zn-dependent oxidoreductase